MRVESYKIEGWQKQEMGLVIEENEEWILVRHIPVDYVLDGYKLYNKRFITERKTLDDENKIERVLKLKNIKNSNPFSFEPKTALDILNWCESKFGLFEFQEADEDELFYGKMHLSTEINFRIDMIDSNGRLDKEFDVTFDSNEIRTITFGTDYFESVRLLFLDNLNSN